MAVKDSQSSESASDTSHLKSMRRNDANRHHSNRLMSSASQLDSVGWAMVEAIGFRMAVGLLVVYPWALVEQLTGSNGRVSVFLLLLVLHVLVLYLGRNYGRPPAGEQGKETES
jgi:hypothetical protein